MVWITAVLGLLVGALLSALYARHAMRGLGRELEGWRSKHESTLLERARFESEAARVPVLAARVEALLAELSQVKADNAQAQTRLEEQARAHAKEVATLKDVRGGIDQELKQLTAEALRANQGAFLELANQVFEKHKTGADAELAARQSAVADLVSPLAEALKGLREETQQLERNRAQAYGTLSGELRVVAETQNAVRAETTRLVQALRASPKTRGRWGEHTLQNVLEPLHLQELQIGVIRGEGDRVVQLPPVEEAGMAAAEEGHQVRSREDDLVLVATHGAIRPPGAARRPCSSSRLPQAAPRNPCRRGAGVVRYRCGSAPGSVWRFLRPRAH